MIHNHHKMKHISILKHNLMRATLMLALIVTCATAWATDVTVTYNVYLTNSYLHAHITRADDSSLDTEWEHGFETLWPGNETHGVDDEYDITFTPSYKLKKHTSGDTGFETNSNTTFTVQVGASGYYIKSVAFKYGSTVTATSSNVAPNMQCIIVSVAQGKCFNAITIVLTTDWTQQFSGGSGTQSDPYLIGNSISGGTSFMSDLTTLCTNVNNGNTYSGVYFKIACANLFVPYYDAWTPIGNVDHPFMGHFDGNGTHFEGMEIENDVQFAGFFGCIKGTSSNYAEVTNLIFDGQTYISITATDNKYYAGAAVGYVGRYASVTNCTMKGGYNTISITANNQYNFRAGTLVGYFYGGDNSRLEGNTVISGTSVTVSSNGSDGTNYVGGLVGYINNFETVNNNFVEVGTLSASGSTPHYIGAIAGGAANLPNTEPNNYFYTSDNNMTGIGSSSNTGFGNTRVWKITCPNNLSVTSSPATTISGTKYYGVGSTVTVGVSDPFYNINSLSASAGSISNVNISSDHKSATFTVGNSGDITLSANISATTSGTTSDGLTWTLSGTGYHELTISGNGAMQNYGHTTVDDLWRTTAPWGWHITKVTVGNGVTRIGNYAFVGCQSLGNVTLGSGLTSIGDGAFNHCDAMTVITLPASVTTLGTGPFTNSVHLQRVNFMHDGAINIGSNNDIVSGCNELQYLVFPSPAGAMANTTGSWSSYTDKLRASLGNQIFKVTNEGGTNAYDIATAADLNNLSTAVNGGANGSGQTFRQTADISVNNFTPIGSSQTNYFGGTYDGGNKTLNVTINDTGNQGTALFRNIQGATIKNLILTGSVTGTIHAAALVGFSRGTNTIDCCKVAANVTVNTATNNNYHCGGVVGHALTSTLNISKTLYCGTITNSGNYVGGFQGWSDGNTINISNCLFVGTYTGTTTGTALFHPIALRNTNSAATVAASNTYYDKIPTVTNSNFIAADGKKTTAVTTAPSNLGSTVATLSYMTVYQNGILYNGNYYAAPVLPSGGTDIYLINNAAQWTAFCDMLYDNATYNRFKGKTVKLGANITVTRMAGSSNHDFCGSFDGQNYTLTFNYGSSTAYANEEYIAPFSYVSNVDEVAANINNLKVAGTIYTSAQFAAGLIGAHWGDVNIQNCRVSTVINSSIDGDGTHGGIVGVDRSGTLTIRGCVFDGQLLGSSTNACGGIVGFRINSATTNIYYSLFAPTNLTIGTDNSATFIRNATNSCKDGCYYTQEFNDGEHNITGQGQKAYAFTTQPSNIGTLVQNYGVVEAYTNGLKFNNKYYVNLGNDLTVNADGTEYTIHNATGWDLFCGLIESGETFSGKTVKLDADISVSRMAGIFITNNNKHAFSGAFNGQNHTLTFTCNTASSNYVAPFGYVKGGNSANGAITISNLNVLTTITAADYKHMAGLIALQDGHVNVTDCNANVTLSANIGSTNTELYPAGLVSQVSSSDNGTLTISRCTTTGTIATNGKYAAGMVGVVQGSANITNSVSSVTINSSTDGDGTHGGLVGVMSTNSSTTITGCLFNGKLLTVGTTTTTIKCGGFVGWCSGSLSISNSLYAPNVVEGETWINDSESATFSRNWSGTPSNCYYTHTLGTAQGKQALSITAGQYVTVSNAGTPIVYSVSGITSYGTGIKYNNVLYAGNGDAVSLTLNHSDPTGYTFNGYTTTSGTLSGNANPYTLTMSDEDVTVSAAFELHPVSVTYLDENGTAQTAQAMALDGSETNLAEGAYFVGLSTVNFDHAITISGNVILILEDNCTINATKGIVVSSGNSLTINAQSTGDSMGTLIATANTDYCAGIGSSYNFNGGNITINGGNISATGGKYAAGIGTGRMNSGNVTINSGTITINGGNVTGTGGENAAGIGGGYYVTGGIITINGGKVTANGESGGAGIGGGNNGACGTITISGGTVTANGGSWGGPGIGGNGGSITISGGKVIATGGKFGSGIGGGLSGAGGTININGGNVSATGGDRGSGIGNGYYGAGGTIILSYIDDTNSVYASSYGGNISIADGKAFTDGTDIYTGTLTGNAINAIAGKTLYPAVAVTLGEGITAVSGIITSGENHYAKPGQTVTVTLDAGSITVPEGYVVSGITVTPTVEVTGSNGTYSFTMPAEDVTVSHALAPIDWANESNGDADHPYMIYNKDQLNLLAYRVNGTHGETQQSDGYEGKYFKLGSDITYPHTSDWNDVTSTESNYEAIGGDIGANTHFHGHFDGDNHTISGIRIYKNGEDYGDKCQGVFGWIIGANIHDLTLADARITGYQETGGIVGYNGGGSVTRCHVASTVTIHAVRYCAWHGGIAGYNNNQGSITYCTSAATLTIASGINCNHYGGICGANISGTLEDNLAIGATVPAANDNNHGAICGYNNDKVLSRNYYYNCTVAGVENATNVGCNNADVTEMTFDNVTYYDGAVYAVIRMVEGYGESTASDHWTFISSPVANGSTIGEVVYLIANPVNNYDLYRLNPSNTMWENSKNSAHSDFTTLVNGQGYLYANKNDVGLVFKGTYNTDDSKDVTLQQGWNLVGNPLTDSAYINTPFFKMNTDGTGIEAVSEYWNNKIAVCTGVVVHTANAGDVTFSKTVPAHSTGNNGNIQMTLAQTITTRGGSSTATLDNAIVSFNEGSQLGKFYFGTQKANIYLPQDGKEYAIVSAGNVGEIPVNFKAHENGTYTLTVSSTLNSQLSTLNFNYLHLIDNMTGADVDLLSAGDCGSSPAMTAEGRSYTFTAKTTDYESRFKLVFVCGDANDDHDGDNETFAFYFNGSWVIANEGRATLQVIDLNGRILSSETINGSVSKSINQPAGVYMIRLINGENVMVQKIVVR